MINKMDSQELLEQLSEKLNSKDWKKQEFNIFNACSIEKQELMHSSFIANLLDPNGTHSQGNFFLKLFLNTLKEKYPELEIDRLADSINIVTEKTIRNDRIDIWIKSKSENAYMLIENKIFAGDGKHQLLRYREYLNGKSEKHKETRKGILLYLTLRGTSASDYSTSDNSTDRKVKKNEPNGYYTISYYITIRKWLDSCLVADMSPRIKSEIEQYVELIKFLNFKSYLRDELLPKIDKAIIDKAIKENEKSKSNGKQIKTFLEYLLYSFDRYQKK
jgi:hypothetical protein